MRPHPFALFVLAVAGVLGAVIGFTASAGVRHDRALATVVAIAAAAATMAGLARWPGFAAVSSEPPATAGAVCPFPSVHSCASAYWVAGSVAADRPNRRSVAPVRSPVRCSRSEVVVAV